MQVEWVLGWREEKALFMETNLWLSVDSIQVKPFSSLNIVHDIHHSEVLKEQFDKKIKFSLLIFSPLPYISIKPNFCSGHASLFVRPGNM